MRRLLGHVIEMPFVTAVSVAALLHSSWSLSTYFTGAEPSPQFTALWLAWVIPGALIGIAIDIGILSIAIELKHGERSRAKLAAFFVLSSAMFYLQFLYLAAHTPLVPVAPGVSATWIAVATTLRDMSVWIVPGLLPVACLLYAFSGRKVGSLNNGNLRWQEMGIKPENVGRPRIHPNNAEKLRFFRLRRRNEIREVEGDERANRALTAVVDGGESEDRNSPQPRGNSKRGRSHGKV